MALTYSSLIPDLIRLLRYSGTQSSQRTSTSFTTSKPILNSRLLLYRDLLEKKNETIFTAVLCG